MFLYNISRKYSWNFSLQFLSIVIKSFKWGFESLRKKSCPWKNKNKSANSVNVICIVNTTCSFCTSEKMKKERIKGNYVCFTFSFEKTKKWFWRINDKKITSTCSDLRDIHEEILFILRWIPIDITFFVLQNIRSMMPKSLYNENFVWNMPMV